MARSRLQHFAFSYIKPSILSVTYRILVQETGNAHATPPGLRVSAGGGDRSLPGGSHARFCLGHATNIMARFARRRCGTPKALNQSGAVHDRSRFHRTKVNNATARPIAGGRGRGRAGRRAGVASCDVTT